MGHPYRLRIILKMPCGHRRETAKWWCERTASGRSWLVSSKIAIVSCSSGQLMMSANCRICLRLKMLRSVLGSLSSFAICGVRCFRVLRRKPSKESHVRLLCLSSFASFSVLPSTKEDCLRLKTTGIWCVAHNQIGLRNAVLKTSKNF